MTALDVTRSRGYGEVMASDTTPVALRLDNALLRRVDALAARWRAERPGVRATRTEVISHLMLVALPLVESPAPKGKR